MTALWTPSNFNFSIKGFEDAASMWISEVSFSKLDASGKDPRANTALQIPLDIMQQASVLEAHFRSVSGLAYESEVVGHVSKIDAFCLKQNVTPSTLRSGANALSVEMTVPGMLLVRFEPKRTDTRYIKSRSGHLIMFEDSSTVSGRISAKSRGMTLATWYFDRGWFFALGPTSIAPGSPGNVLFVPERLRRG